MAEVAKLPAKMVNFRQEARECVQLAKAEKHDAVRTILLGMALGYAKLSDRAKFAEGIELKPDRSRADYYSILARAVRGLDTNTPAARQRLYARARSALISEMQNAYPPIPRSEIMAAQMALGAAIEEVEAGAVPEPVNAAIEKFKEHGRSREGVQSVALPFASTVPSEKMGTHPILGAAKPDYYPLVAKAVGTLDPNTADARRKVYDRARAAFLSEVHKLVPAWSQSEIMAEQFFLELAIGKVEAALQPLQCAPPRLGTPTMAPDRNAQRSRRSLGNEPTKGRVARQSKNVTSREHGISR